MGEGWGREEADPQDQAAWLPGMQPSFLTLSSYLQGSWAYSSQPGDPVRSTEGPHSSLVPSPGLLSTRGCLALMFGSEVSAGCLSWASPLSLVSSTQSTQACSEPADPSTCSPPPLPTSTPALRDRTLPKWSLVSYSTICPQVSQPMQTRAMKILYLLLA